MMPNVVSSVKREKPNHSAMGQNILKGKFDKLSDRIGNCGMNPLVRL